MNKVESCFSKVKTIRKPFFSNAVIVGIEPLLPEETRTGVRIRSSVSEGDRPLTDVGEEISVLKSISSRGFKEVEVAGGLKKSRIVDEFCVPFEVDGSSRIANRSA